MLIALRDELSKDFRQRYIGKSRPVLFEESVLIGGKSYMVGHTPEYIKTAVLTDEPLENVIRDVTLSSFLTDEILSGTLYRETAYKSLICAGDFINNRLRIGA